jgi:hypothetical protein
MSIKSRRQFIKQSAGIVITLPVLSGFKINLQDEQNPRILFRFGWDLNDNDDIAIIPSLYRIGQKSFQKCEFYLWLNDSDSNLMDMLNNNFTDLKIVTGDIDGSGQPTTEELKSILSETDLFFYATGAAKKVDWADEGQDGIETRSLNYCLKNKIPYAIMGIGEIPDDGAAFERFLNITSNANYLYCTSSSIDKILKGRNIKFPNLQQIPNPLFAFDLRNVSKSREILKNYNLTDKDFLTIDFKGLGLSEEKIKKYANKITALITSWVENTEKHVFILPNNPADVEVTLENIYAPLAVSVKSKVVFFQERLMPDIAASIYEKSRIVSGMSLFPVCSAIQSGIPVFFLSTMDLSANAKTIEDMGLKNAIQELDSQTGEALSEILLEINSKYVSGIIESDKARDYAMKKLLDQFEGIYKIINKSTGKENASKKKDKKK